ncbi:MAG: TetR/AcrR family transcriptional regulator [Kaiparowitsia implicata GSE-PSE-MK54-09C]|jgi:AcrR family transcriptional regulator|nr:TetR/AcrR family transcriptional regulator [Kaiparowitsia implicata GSE-PSE-MK54-09C]
MPKIVDHDQYRKELLNQCFDLFAEKGYASVTMRQIASWLDVSTGTLYHYFPNKEMLFAQFVDELSQRDILQAKTEMTAGQTLSDRIRIVFDYFERNRDYFFKQTLICVDFHQQMHREGIEISDPMKQVGERIEQSVEELLIELLGFDEPELVSFLMTFIDGLMMSDMYVTRRVDFQKQGELIIKMINAYVEKHPNSIAPDLKSLT